MLQRAAEARSLAHRRGRRRLGRRTPGGSDQLTARRAGCRGNGAAGGGADGARRGRGWAARSFSTHQPGLCSAPATPFTPQAPGSPGLPFSRWARTGAFPSPQGAPQPPPTAAQAAQPGVPSARRTRIAAVALSLGSPSVREAARDSLGCRGPRSGRESGDPDEKTAARLDSEVFPNYPDGTALDKEEDTKIKEAFPFVQISCNHVFQNIRAFITNSRQEQQSGERREHKFKKTERYVNQCNRQCGPYLDPNLNKSNVKQFVRNFHIDWTFDIKNKRKGIYKMCLMKKAYALKICPPF
nr:uncharacterized protein LOC123275751 [Equus asinus]